MLYDVSKAVRETVDLAKEYFQVDWYHKSAGMDTEKLIKIANDTKENGRTNFFPVIGTPHQRALKGFLKKMKKMPDVVKEYAVNVKKAIRLD